MFHAPILVKYFRIEFFVLLILFGKRIQCDDCQSIETLSFGSDIDIKCNQTYLTFVERNPNGFQWEFKNKSSLCRQQGILQSTVNECSLKQINTKYLSVPLKSTLRYEFGCIYCLIDYKPIAPSIHVKQSNEYNHAVYTFSITATGLNENESFEIIWAKRVHIYHPLSFNYWFYRNCYYQDIDILDRTSHSIVFSVADTTIKRVEFIVRRCQNTCLKIKPCSNDDFGVESNKDYFRTPEALEKIVCDEDCLKGILPSTTTTTTTTTTTSTTTTTMTTSETVKVTLFSSTIQLSQQKQTMKSLIFYPLTGLLIALLFIILGCLIIFRIKGSRSNNTYEKTSNINLDEKKETMD